MQGVACRKGWFTTPWTALVAVLLVGLPLANGNCEFPETWKGKWFLYSRESPVIVNTTTFDDRTCIERNKDRNDMFVVYDKVDSCYRCMIINARHDSVIQYRESSCSNKATSVSEMSESITLDESLFSMFRMNARPIPCPFAGPPFTFSYFRGRGTCQVPENQAESCTDESKLLLKYQACPDIEGTESTTEELQCLATWKDGRNFYLVGTLKPGSRTTVPNEEAYRCFLYDKSHRNGKVEYTLAQSGDATCNGLSAVSEGSQMIKLTKEEKEHRRCKYPSWVLKHHSWHTLNGSKNYHFLAGNSSLKVTYKEENVSTLHEEKIVCHNLEETKQTANSGPTVKLVAHVTSGCDIGYVCMIFHQRDQHIIEIQQSEHKAIIPDEACKLWDPSGMPYTTLITSSLHKRRCPQPGRYSILNSLSSQALSMRRRNKRRAKSAESTTSKIRQDDEDEQCRNTDVHIGCSSMDQNEVIMAQSCKSGEIATSYSCQGSWEENGTWFTIVSRNKSSTERQTQCFSMRFSDPSDKLGRRNSRMDSTEQELLLSKPSHLCQRNVDDQWTYRLMSQGVCEDLTKAASSSASSSSRVSFALLIGAAVMSRLLSR